MFKNQVDTFLPLKGSNKHKFENLELNSIQTNKY